ncbi:S-layer homology domain-containing protein [Paenibacillus piri]|uniref:S-layer homology domain-containing protein n=1 Tax=Paenibacillus piri TaxID=2547395 RepID=A0A4R5KRQ3_9BACL|nr:S-layer homology domain-containing protein [Paenibacillus piri]TDF98092.1 S-layer homology domain-containing protein [Paenibacillus piri]
MKQLRKWAAIITICSVMSASVAAVQAAETAKFTDVKAHWAEKTIYQLVEQGLLDGFPDKTFRPDDPVTADQFIKILLLSYSQLYPNGERNWKTSFVQQLSPANQSVLKQDYRDFSFKPGTVGYWAKPFIDLAGALNLISKNQFADYKANLKREDVAEIIYYTIKETEYLEDEKYSIGLASQFGDFQSVTSRQQKFVSEVIAKGIMEGYPNGYFGMGRNVTRAEALRILERLMDKSLRVKTSGQQNELVRVVPTKDGSYKKLVFPESKMLQTYDMMEDAGKLRGTNYDLEETTLRLFKDAEAKNAALNGATDSARFSNEVSLWLEPQYRTYGVTVKVQDGVLARNMESIRKFTDYIFGFSADTFYAQFVKVCEKVARKEAVENATMQIGDYSVEVHAEPDSRTIIFSILHK